MRICAVNAFGCCRESCSSGREMPVTGLPQATVLLSVLLRIANFGTFPRPLPASIWLPLSPRLGRVRNTSREKRNRCSIQTRGAFITSILRIRHPTYGRSALAQSFRTGTGRFDLFGMPSADDRSLRTTDGRSHIRVTSSLHNRLALRTPIPGANVLRGQLNSTSPRPPAARLCASPLRCARTRAETPGCLTT